MPVLIETASSEAEADDCPVLALADDSVKSDSIDVLAVADLESEVETVNSRLMVEVAYPNPADDELTVSLETEDEYTIQLLQENGKEVFQGEFITDQVVLPVEKYPNGLYYVRVTKGDQSVVKRVYIKK